MIDIKPSWAYCRHVPLEFVFQWVMAPWIFHIFFYYNYCDRTPSGVLITLSYISSLNITLSSYYIYSGKSYDVQDMLTAAAAMRDIGVKIMALGVRLRDTSELKAIASKPEFALQANFTSASLAAVQSQVQAALCNLVSYHELLFSSI